MTSDWAGHANYIWALISTPQGLVSTAENGEVIAWSAEGVPRRLEGHHAGVYCAACSPDGKRLVTGGFDNTVRLWDLESGSELLTLRGHTGSVHFVAFSPDGESIMSGSDRGNILVWRARWAKPAGITPAPAVAVPGAP
jgi:WD40 repeat protein